MPRADSSIPEVELSTEKFLQTLLPIAITGSNTRIEAYKENRYM